jgi:hypothetical protein
MHARYRLQPIACDVTNRALLVLPDDLRRYRRLGERDCDQFGRFENADAACGCRVDE